MFPLGQIVVTSSARDALEQWGQTAEALLARHQAGDWGDVTDEQRRLNEVGLAERFNLISSYVAPSGQCLTVFTKADRSITMVHLSPDHRDFFVGQVMKATQGKANPQLVNDLLKKMLAG